MSTKVFSQTTHTVNINGLSFVPANLSIILGDTVFFNGNANHPIVQVSSDTWNTNQNTPLSGGFSFSSGVGKIALDSLATYYYICQNHYLSGMKGKIIVSEATSLNYIEQTEFTLFPNPLRGNNLNISSDKLSIANLKIEIFDITGKPVSFVKKQVSNKQISMDCSKLNSGIYFIQFIDNSIVYTSKFVKK